MLEARIMLGIYCLVALLLFSSGYGWTLLLCWLLPRFLGEPIQRILRVAEHVGCEESPDLLKNTRTTLSNRIVHLIAWQMPFHSEHHLYPNVPFYHLEKIHKHVANRVIVEPEGYVAGQRKIIQWLRNRAIMNYSGSPRTPIL